MDLTGPCKSFQIHRRYIEIQFQSQSPELLYHIYPGQSGLSKKRSPTILEHKSHTYNIRLIRPSIKSKTNFKASTISRSSPLHYFLRALVYQQRCSQYTTKKKRRLVVAIYIYNLSLKKKHLAVAFEVHSHQIVNSSINRDPNSF